jgi:hypothetical protein
METLLRPTPRRRFHAPISQPSERVLDILKRSNAPAKQRQFVPVMHPDLYFRDLETHGVDTTRLRHLHEENALPDETVKKPKKSHPIPPFADHIPVRLTVKKCGSVRVRFCTEMATLHEEFYSHGIKPSLEERIKACRTFGYPDEILCDVIKKDDTRRKNIPMMDEFIHTIFGDFSDKKSTAPKKKNLYQILKIKKPVRAMPDEDDIIIDDEDDDIEDEPLPIVPEDD